MDKAALKSAEFLEHKRKKRWIDKSGNCGYMMYPRSLYITWGREHWVWNCFKETSDENIEVAKLEAVCWLDVRGKFKISDLSPGVLYEVVYVVKVKNGGTSWELPIMLRLVVPNAGVSVIKERQVSLLEKPKGKVIELSVGNFVAGVNESGEVGFDLYDHGGHWKTGLVLMGAIIRPKC